MSELIKFKVKSLIEKVKNEKFSALPFIFDSIEGEEFPNIYFILNYAKYIRNNENVIKYFCSTIENYKKYYFHPSPLVIEIADCGLVNHEENSYNNINEILGVLGQKFYFPKLNNQKIIKQINFIRDESKDEDFLYLCEQLMTLLNKIKKESRDNIYCSISECIDMNFCESTITEFKDEVSNNKYEDIFNKYIQMLVEAINKKCIDDLFESLDINELEAMVVVFCNSLILMRILFNLKEKEEFTLENGDVIPNFNEYLENRLKEILKISDEAYSKLDTFVDCINYDAFKDNEEYYILTTLQEISKKL